MSVKNPNPQAAQLSAYEAVVFVLTMRPALTDPWMPSDTFQINIRDQFNNVVVQGTAFTVTDFDAGAVEFPLTSSQTGNLDTGETDVGDTVANPSGGDFLFDVWQTTPGSEKRLAWGSLSDLGQQWKP